MRLLETGWTAPPTGRVGASLAVAVAASTLCSAQTIEPIGPNREPRPPSQVESSRSLQLDAPETRIGSFSFGLWRLDRDAQSCSPCTEPAFRNPNEPWSARNVVRLTKGNTQLFGGVMGLRNYSVPSYAAEALGVSGSAIIAVPVVTPADSATQWNVLAGVRHTLKKLPAGQTLGIVADVNVPVSASAGPAAMPSTSRLQSAAVRFGIVLGF